MTEKSSSGYRGEALEAVNKVGAEVGDTLRVIKNGEVYEGILIPRSEYGDEKHLVIKLKNGYNIGIRIESNTKVEKIGKGTKPSFVSPSLPQQNERLPKVTILSTGGTIASRVDYRTGAVRPALTASDLYSVVPELANIARIDAHILFSLFSENIAPEDWTKMAKATALKIDEGADGVVIAHGTDTMGYTAAALSFALQNLPVPIILVGSQRSADRPSSDAATNLVGAVTAAAKAPFAQVVVAMHETISDTSIALHSATKVRKCHTSRRDTFRSINAPPIARMQGQSVIMLANDYIKRDSSRKPTLKPKFCDKVALVKFHPGIDSAMIDWHTNKGYKGLILEGTGLGHVGNKCFHAIGNAVNNGVVVGMTSQCIWGRVDMNVYDTGRDLQALGIVPLEDMLSETALVKLMWILGQTENVQEAQRLMMTNIAGELSPRTLPEKSEQ